MVLYCTVLYSTALYCTKPCCTVLYCNSDINLCLQSLVGESPIGEASEGAPGSAPASSLSPRARMLLGARQHLEDARRQYMTGVIMANTEEVKDA